MIDLKIATAVALPDEVSFDAFRGAFEGRRVAAFYASDGGRLTALLADDAAGRLRAVSTRAESGFPSLTPELTAVHLFEREIAEETGLVPEGHPWLKPVRFAGPGAPQIGVMDYYRVEGEEVHEVAVGPVHAGIIEPGHFRFQCHGETVFHLEISLGYQHRGIERALIGGPNKRSLHLLETAAGDTTVGHATAYCQVIEALSETRVPPRAQALRGVALELERLANHIGDLGALANDVAYLPTAAYCGRIRGDFLNMTAVLCGNRFGRSLVVPGGVAFDVDDARTQDLLKRLEAAAKDSANAVNLLWDTPSVMARFEDTGHVSEATCRELGLVGPAARACGVGIDVRHDHPAGIWQLSHIPVSTWHTGDVFARATVRWLECQRAVTFLRDTLQSLPAGPVRAPVGPLAPGRLAVGLCEAWRGEVCHVAETDLDEKTGAGRFRRYKVVDPSFHNWSGLAMALRDQAISDFPLCNKSFNLSYCGFDL